MKKYILYFSVLILFYSCSSSKSIVPSEPNDTNSNYIILTSGEKINKENSKNLIGGYIDDKLVFTGRTYVIDSSHSKNKSVDSYGNTQNGFVKRIETASKFSDAKTAYIKRIVDGKVCVYLGEELYKQGVNNNGLSYNENKAKDVLYAKKGDQTMMIMSIPTLKIMLADNSEAVDQLKSLEKKFLKRLDQREQIKIIYFYNAH